MTDATRHPYALPATVRDRLVYSPDGCLLYTGRLRPDGYAVVSVSRRLRALLGGPKQWRVHRLVYSLWVGPIPEGLTLDHLCKTPRCANPSHLEPVPSGVNSMRGNGIAAQRARQTSCVNGHPFTSENVWIRPGTGHRQCRQCNRDRVNLRRRTAGAARGQVTCGWCGDPFVPNGPTTLFCRLSCAHYARWNRRKGARV